MDLEDFRVRIETVKRGSLVRAFRIVGPRLPPAPMRRTVVSAVLVVAILRQ